jgi:hypothetical protein
MPQIGAAWKEATRALWPFGCMPCNDPRRYRVISRLRQNASRDELIFRRIGTPRDDAPDVGIAEAGQSLQLLRRRRVDIDEIASDLGTRSCLLRLRRGGSRRGDWLCAGNAYRSGKNRTGEKMEGAHRDLRPQAPCDCQLLSSGSGHRACAGRGRRSARPRDCG